MSSMILKTEGLAKEFFLHEQGKTIPSCTNVDLEAHEGELTAVTGQTGVGKSTVLKCIYRSYLPSMGRILYYPAHGGRIDLAVASDNLVLELRRREIAFVTQFLHCLPRRSTIDVVAEPLVARGIPRTDAREQAAVTLAALDVPERLWSIPPATFSGGEKQRVNLARGIVQRPRLLLLDEPTASLDNETTERVVQLIGSIKAEGVAMIAIFHQPDLVRRLADRVIRLFPPAPAAMTMGETWP